MYHSHVYTISGDYVGYIRHDGIIDLMKRYPADQYYWMKDAAPNLFERRFSRSY